MESWDSEAEWVPAMAGAVEGRVYRGTEELQAYFAELFDSFAEVRLEDREYRDLGDRVLMLSASACEVTRVEQPSTSPVASSTRFASERSSTLVATSPQAPGR